jgi:hypothetical protein
VVGYRQHRTEPLVCIKGRIFSICGTMSILRSLLHVVSECALESSPCCSNGFKVPGLEAGLCAMLNSRFPYWKQVLLQQFMPGAYTHQTKSWLAHPQLFLLLFPRYNILLHFLPQSNFLQLSHYVNTAEPVYKLHVLFNNKSQNYFRV